MEVYFRADAAALIGSGHVMRCLTLAEQLRRRGAAMTFICREFPGNLCDFIAAQGFAVRHLPLAAETALTAAQDTWLGADWRQDAREVREILGQHPQPSDWLVVDHYAVDWRWEQVVRPMVRRMLVIDDLANRRHDCDVLLDQNLHRRMEKRYAGLVPERCRLLLGPRYALLRREFWDARRQSAPRDGTVRRLLIFFGGSDPTNETAKALTTLNLLGRGDIYVDVVVGGINPRREEIRRQCATMPHVTFHCQVAAMAALLAQDDLALGAGGTSAWERCCLGLPALTVVVASNQAEATAALATAGAVRDLGWHEQVTSAVMAAALADALAAPAELRRMSEAAWRLMGDYGETVADVMCRQDG